MAKSKEPKAGKAGKAGKGKKGKGPGAEGAASGKRPKVKKAKVKGAFLDRVTDLVAVLFGVSLVAQQLLGQTGS